VAAVRLRYRAGDHLRGSALTSGDPGPALQGRQVPVRSPRRVGQRSPPLHNLYSISLRVRFDQALAVSTMAQRAVIGAKAGNCWCWHDCSRPRRLPGRPLVPVAATHAPSLESGSHLPRR